MKNNLVFSNKRNAVFSINMMFTLLFVFIFSLLSACSAGVGDISDGSSQPSTALPGDGVALTQSAVSTLSPCDLLDKQTYYDILQDSTLLFEFNNGSCWISNQWETKSIQIGVFQGGQAYQAIRWYTREMVAGWNQPDLISYVNQILIDGEGMSLPDFQQLAAPLYERIDFRNERIFSIGDTAFWYIYPLASANILDLSVADIYMRISINGLFPEEALSASLTLANEILTRLPQEFVIDHDFGQITAISYATATVVSGDIVPKTDSLQVERPNIFFGDLCGDESTRIRVSLVNPETADIVYLVYRLASPQETNTTWVTRPMNLLNTGAWEYTLSAESDFAAFKLVNGAKIEYAISILYAVDGVFRSPTYNDIQINQCTLDN